MRTFSIQLADAENVILEELTVEGDFASIDDVLHRLAERYDASDASELLRKQEPSADEVTLGDDRQAVKQER